MSIGEFAPGGSNAKMTKSQVRKYIADMKKAQEEAKRKLEEAENGRDTEKEAAELKKLEKKLDEIL